MDLELYNPVFMCVHVHMPSVYVCVSTAYVWKPETDVTCLPQSLPPCYLGTLFLTEPGIL